MTAEAVLLGFDMGATSVKVGAFSVEGKLLAVQSAPNAPKPQINAPAEWRVWDVEEIWQNLCACCKAVLAKLDEPYEVKGVAVSGFGVDGVPMTREGKQLYPCISWHCGRTVPQSKKLSDTVGNQRLYELTGYHNYAICTLNRFLWLQENEPNVLEKMDYWLHVQDYIAYRLTGRFSTESTIASTTLFLDIKKRAWAEDLLNELELTSEYLSPLYDSGTPIGPITEEASLATGISQGAIVATGGHDTELAILGTGVNRKETFLDINGTWEILMAITDSCQPSMEGYSKGLDWECHAIPGWWNIQALMLAGGVIDWIRGQFYRDNASYEAMIQEASEAPLGANNICILPALVRGMGPSQGYDPLGAILGITTQTSRGDVARAMFEALSYQFYQQIEAIEKSVGIKADSIRVTGGGQKNPFWMQMKADLSGRALDVLQNVESTLLGAAILAGLGSGIYRNADEALGMIQIPVETVEPDMKRHEQYRERYEKVIAQIPVQMEGVFKAIHLQS